MATKTRRMEDRIRFGSDGNGVFVVTSEDGETWRLWDSADHFLARLWDTAHGLLIGLSEDETAAGFRYLTGDYDPSHGPTTIAKRPTSEEIDRAVERCTAARRGGKSPRTGG